VWLFFNLDLMLVASQTERFEDMVEAIKKLAKTGTELTSEERSLVAVAYKEVMSSRRAAWRCVVKMEHKEETLGGEQHLAVLRTYRAKLEQEMANVCGDLLVLIDKYLIPTASSEESRAFFLKLKGDYYRYISEFLTAAAKKEAAENALVSYKEANDLVVTHLPPTHPLRLGVALNLSVFYYDILHASDRAQTVARQAFEDAMGELNQLNEDLYKESVLLMQLLRDNVTLWSSSGESLPSVV
jgi:14-3-3 protein epsilon